MTPPRYEPPVDPNLQAQTDAATEAKTAALQLRLKADTADVMARYGARTALTGSGPTPQIAGGGPIAGGKIGGRGSFISSLVTS